MSDLVKRLRDGADSETGKVFSNPLCNDAADRIEKQDKTIEQFEKRHDKIAGVVLELLKLFKPPEDKT